MLIKCTGEACNILILSYKSVLLSDTNGILSVSNGLLTENKNKSPFSLNVAKWEREFGLNINTIISKEKSPKGTCTRQDLNMPHGFT